MIRLSVLLALALAGAWCLIVGEISVGQLFLGLIAGSLVVLITGTGRGRVVPLYELPRRLFYLGAYLLVLIPYDIIQSNLDLARRLLHLRPAIRPGIVRMRPGPISEAASALVAHAITMSPGQMVVDYSKDRSIMYVHVIDVTDVPGRQAFFWRMYYRIVGRLLS